MTSVRRGPLSWQALPVLCSIGKLVCKEADGGAQAIALRERSQRVLWGEETLEAAAFRGSSVPGGGSQADCLADWSVLLWVWGPL